MSFASKLAARKAAAMLHIYTPVLSDEDCKKIQKAGGGAKNVAAAIKEHGPPYTAHEVMCLVEAAGLGNLADDKDDTLQKYAKYIHNYKYTYTDEAKKVDPNIDTSIEHNGPMAQDIEKVNPAAVKVDPKSGYKTVDIGRLALMDHGVIADLAREVQGLKNELHST